MVKNKKVIEFGSRLAKIRKAMAITQAALAERVGVEPGYIASLEQGARTPSFRLLLDLADKLHVSPSQFFQDALPEQVEVRGLQAEAAEFLAGLKAGDLKRVLRVGRAAVE